MQIKQQSIIDRRLDARKKIMLGGLFVKSGLDTFYPHDPATLYGMLLHAKQLASIEPALLMHWKNLGKDLLIK